jgi:NADPH:quinone reductase-like Zn-dependent oxidoreductase
MANIKKMKSQLACNRTTISVGKNNEHRFVHSHTKRMHQEPNSISMQQGIPPTQPIAEPEPLKRPSEPPTPTQSTKQTISPKQSANLSTKQLGKQSVNLSTKRTTPSLNDSAFTPLSMQALYYAPEGPLSEVIEGIPEGEITDVNSPDTETTVIRKKGTDLVFDAKFPTPHPTSQQYLLKVHTAAFCHDEIRLATALNPPITTPRIPLHSICGTVASTPREHDKREEGPRFRLGDQVFGLVSYKRDGGAADYVVATEAEMAPKPDNIGVAEAAALALPALTAWQALFRYAGLDPDVPRALNTDDEEFDSGGNGTGRWEWQRRRREAVLGSAEYGYGHRKSTNGNGNGNGAASGRSSGRSPGDTGGGVEQRSEMMNDNASGSGAGTGNGNGNGKWAWHWNRRDTILNDKASGAGLGAGSGIANIDKLARPASKVDSAQLPNANGTNTAKSNGSIRRESLISLVSGTPKATGKAPRAASTIDPNPKNTVRRNSLSTLIRGNSKSNNPGGAAGSNASGTSSTRRGSLLNLVGEASRSRLGSIMGNPPASETQKPANIRVLITNARDNEIGRIAVQILRVDALFPAPVRPWVCVTCTPAETEIIENDWKVDEIIVVPHLPSPSECDIARVFRARRWQPVDIVLDCAGGEVFRASHAAGVVKDHGAVLTVVDLKVAMQSPLVPENDELGEKKRGILSRFVPVNPDGPAIERIGELVEEDLIRGKEARVVNLARAADLLDAGAAGTAGGLRGDMVVIKVH